MVEGVQYGGGSAMWWRECNHSPSNPGAICRVQAGSAILAV